MSSEMSYFDTLARWHELNTAIKHMQAEERALREGLFAGTFPEPEEGTNKVELPDGRILKAVHKIYRNVDAEALANQPKGWLPKKVLDEVIRHKPELVIKAYRGLEGDTKKKLDDILIIKPGLPSLELIEPKPDTPEVSP